MKRTEGCRCATGRRDNIIIGILTLVCVSHMNIDLMMGEMDGTNGRGREKREAMRMEDALDRVLLWEPPTVKERTPTLTTGGVR